MKDVEATEETKLLDNSQTKKSFSNWCVIILLTTTAISIFIFSVYWIYTFFQIYGNSEFITHSNELLWESNFTNMDSLKNNWNIENLEAGMFNEEIQRYTDDVFKFTKNNELIIQTIKNKNTHDVKSGRINTQGKVNIKYGYIEGMMKFTDGKTFWPAFWMLGDNNKNWPESGEIDIFEWTGRDPDACYSSLHAEEYYGINCYSNYGMKKTEKTYANEYHKFAIEWKPNSIKWILDDKLFLTATPELLYKMKKSKEWIFNDRSFYFIINSACGAFFGVFRKTPQDIYEDLSDYNEFRIKYVKVFKTIDGYGDMI